MSSLHAHALYFEIGENLHPNSSKVGFLRRCQSGFGHLIVCMSYVVMSK